MPFATAAAGNPEPSLRFSNRIDEIVRPVLSDPFFPLWRRVSGFFARSKRRSLLTPAGQCEGATTQENQNSPSIVADAVTAHARFPSQWSSVQSGRGEHDNRVRARRGPGSRPNFDGRVDEILLPIAFAGGDITRESEIFVTRTNHETFQEVYQRNPLRCSSAISLARASVCARRYWPTAARMAFSKAMGAA